MTDEEKLYTLSQAKKKIALDECNRLGCDVSCRMTIRGYDGLIKLRVYGCTRCSREYVPKDSND